MAEPNVIVSRRVRVEIPPGRELATAARKQEIGVELDGGRRVRLLMPRSSPASRHCASLSISK